MSSIVCDNGDILWYSERGVLHRLDGPAVIRINGELEWWVNGDPHRFDGPAIIKIDGTKFWCQFGILHREDGPAVEYADGDTEWWVNGEQISSSCKINDNWIKEGF